MNRKAFGKLVAALRKEHFDEEGNRLTQMKLAQKAQALDPRSPLNEVIIGKIERGARAILDDDTLLSLANALELTIGERREFFLAATGLDHQQIYHLPDEANDILDSVIQKLGDIQLPAFLVDTYLDVIALNAAVLPLYDYTFIDLTKRIEQPTGFNLVDFIFSPDFESQRELMGQQQWYNFAAGMVMYFRRMTLQYRMTDYFAYLLSQLRRYPIFRWHWQQVFFEEKRYFVGSRYLITNSQEARQLSYLTAPLTTLTPYGNLEIVTHIPLSSETAKTFSQIAEQGPTSVYRLSPWPEKTIPK